VTFKEKEASHVAKKQESLGTKIFLKREIKKKTELEKPEATKAQLSKGSWMLVTIASFQSLQTGLSKY